MGRYKKYQEPITNPLTDESKILEEWAEFLEISRETFYKRYEKYLKGAVDAKFLFTKGKIQPMPNVKQNYLYNPITKETKSYSEWAKILNTTVRTIGNRDDALKEGRMTAEEVFTPMPTRQQILKDRIMRLQQTDRQP